MKKEVVFEVVAEELAIELILKGMLAADASFVERVYHRIMNGQSKEILDDLKLGDSRELAMRLFLEALPGSEYMADPLEIVKQLYKRIEDPARKDIQPYCQFFSKNLERTDSSVEETYVSIEDTLYVLAMIAMSNEISLSVQRTLSGIKAKLLAKIHSLRTAEVYTSGPSRIKEMIKEFFYEGYFSHRPEHYEVYIGWLKKW